ncbi:Glyceraldehyde-3-phosphate dehydrogenase [Desulfovibrionales bacterium]
MAVKLGINGFGRIGRYLVRLLAEEMGIKVTVINARADNYTIAHLLKYDTAHGTFLSEVISNYAGLIINGDQILVTRDGIGQWKWREHGIDIVVETTGKIKDADGLKQHLTCGAKKVVISAPAKGVDLTVVMGVNEHIYDPDKHNVISNASCTTNCMALAVKVLHDQFGVSRGLMTTVHSYTMSQRILDGSANDLRRARAAAVNLIPTTTGAAKAVAEVIPELKDRLDGMAVRVPMPNVSLVDLVIELKKDVTVESVNAAFKAAAIGLLKGNIGFSELPLVSSDYNGSSFGGVVDGLCTNVIDKRLVKLIIWYDNEAGFTHQLLRLIKLICKNL